MRRSRRGPSATDDTCGAMMSRFRSMRLGDRRAGGSCRSISSASPTPRPGLLRNCQASAASVSVAQPRVGTQRPSRQGWGQVALRINIPPEGCRDRLVSAASGAARRAPILASGKAGSRRLVSSRREGICLKRDVGHAPLAGSRLPSSGGQWRQGRTQAVSSRQEPGTASSHSRQRMADRPPDRSVPTQAPFTLNRSSRPQTVGT